MDGVLTDGWMTLVDSGENGRDGRVVKALDLKSNGVSPRRFKSCSRRTFTSLLHSIA